jgi:hypothetical protein
MQLLTQSLPSGYPYKFDSLNINSMYFGQILEYLEFVPSNEIEKFYFDYKLVLADDPHVDDLLLTDLDYVVFFKKGITISEDLEFKTSAICPRCKSTIDLNFKLSNVRFKHLDPRLYSEILEIKFDNTSRIIRMPTVKEFMTIFSNYRRYKKITDMKLIKLIALFQDSTMYQQLIEQAVVRSTHEDITMLATLDKLFYDTIDPLKVHCDNCVKLDLDTQKGGEVEVSIDKLISNYFREIIENNPIAESKIILREIH